MAPNRNTKVTLYNVRKATSTSPKIVLVGKRKPNKSPSGGIIKKSAFNDVENISKTARYTALKELLRERGTQTRAKSNELSSSRLPLTNIPLNAVGERLPRVKSIPMKPKVVTNATSIEPIKKPTKPATRSSTTRSTVNTSKVPPLPKLDDNRKITFAKKNVVIFPDERKVTFANKVEVFLPDERKVTFANKAEVISPDERKVTFANKPEIIDAGANIERQRDDESVSPVQKETSVTKLSATFVNKSEVIDDAGGVSKKNDQNNISPAEPVRPTTRQSARLSLRNSMTSDKSAESSLYISAVEEIFNASIKETTVTKNQIPLSEFDKELLHDPHQVSLYAMEIFEYLKTREADFVVVDYMTKQRHINASMRAVLVDWLVEVQENFELNHETLYLAVKIVDMYLSKVEIRKEKLQLVGAAALFISCKYDERSSPFIDDFVYICDNAFTQDDFLVMEQSVLRHINFELSFPISYSFLRRYARCAKIQMPLLTLARYILELSLLDYNTVQLSDSKQAAAALYLAFKMVKHSDWTDQLVYYTGYKKNDLKDIVLLFNRILHQKPNKHLSTIRTKYSHELFFEVTKTPLLNDDELDLDITNPSA